MIRVVHCPEDAHDLPWVLAKDCSHWDQDCPRARKAKKNKHKLKRSPGFDVLLVRADHDYVPEPDSQNRWVAQEKKLLKTWSWYDAPSAMRYSDCECLLPWFMHQPEHEGVARYVGRRTPRGTLATHPGLLVTCANCGLKGAVDE